MKDGFEVLHSPNQSLLLCMENQQIGPNRFGSELPVNLREGREAPLGGQESWEGIRVVGAISTFHGPLYSTKAKFVQGKKHAIPARCEDFFFPESSDFLRGNTPVIGYEPGPHLSPPYFLGRRPDLLHIFMVP
jgi:hypothetical protein